MHNPDYSSQIFNDYFAKVHREVVDEEFPLMLRNPGGAIWLRKGPDTSRMAS